MRTNIIKSIFLIGVLTFISCDSSLRMPDVQKVSYPLITVAPTSDVLIVNGVLNGKFTVDMYYKDYPQDSKVVIAMNGDYTKIKTFTASVKTFPSDLTITAIQLKSLFGLSAINDGDYFEIGLDVLMDNGTWYPAFNQYGVAYGSGPYNLKGASPIITFKAPLPIDKFVGQYKCDEPAESYDYKVSFSRASISSVNTANYWNSGWSATFSVDFANNTYSMPLTKFTSGYSAIESGTVDVATGKMVGDYTIYENGTPIETGVHTYTKL